MKWRGLRFRHCDSKLWMQSRGFPKQNKISIGLWSFQKIVAPQEPSDFEVKLNYEMISWQIRKWIDKFHNPVKWIFMKSYEGNIVIKYKYKHWNDQQTLQDTLESIRRDYKHQQTLTNHFSWLLRFEIKVFLLLTLTRW